MCEILRDMDIVHHCCITPFVPVPVDYSYVLVFDENKDVYKRIRIDGSKSSYISKFKI